MRALVTGATGFIGGNLVKELLTSGYQVRALARKGSDRRNIASLDVEVAEGDLLDPPSLESAMVGCQVLFHVAAVYALWTPKPEVVYATNVQGTECLLVAARVRGIEKVVYTSTESTLAAGDTPGPGTRVIGRGRGLATEAVQAQLQQLGGHYERSKLLAERVALEANRAGLPVVVVNPTVPVGPGDLKPTPTGQFILDFLNKRMPAFVDTGLNLVDVGDVARGHVLALERGRPGERYILGNRNLTFREILVMLGRIAGIPAPRVRVPLWAALAAAYVAENVIARATGRAPRIPVAGVRAAAHYRYFDCSKAVRELGMPQTPVEEALHKAVQWFRENGHAR